MKALLAFLGMLLAAPWLASWLATQPLGISPERDWVRQGYAHYRNGDYGDAEVSFRRALAHDPAFAEANYNLAQALYQQQRYAEALKYYVAARPNLPLLQQPSLAHNQGNALLKLNQWAAAAAAYRQALRLWPGYTPAQKNLSYVLAKLAEKKKDVIRNVNQAQKKLDEKANQSQKEQSDESSEKPADQNADQTNSQSKSNIQSPQEQLNAADMEQMLKQLDQSEKQIRGRATQSKAEKKVKTEAKDW